jgi:hypothetical protein
MASAFSYFCPKVLECSADVCARWAIWAACYVLGVASITYGIATILAYIPIPDVTDQPPELDQYNRVDLMSLRYLILEGNLWFPPPPPSAPPAPPPPPGWPPFAPR